MYLILTWNDHGRHTDEKENTAFCDLWLQNATLTSLLKLTNKWIVLLIASVKKYFSVQHQFKPLSPSLRLRFGELLIPRCRSDFRFEATRVFDVDRLRSPLWCRCEPRDPAPDKRWRLVLDLERDRSIVRFLHVNINKYKHYIHIAHVDNDASGCGIEVNVHCSIK